MSTRSRADRQEHVALHADSEGVELVVGDRVCGGEPGTEDYDEGVVAAINHGQVDVGWDSGVRTVQPADLLTRMTP